MAGSVTKGLIGAEDMHWWNGNEVDYTRPGSTGVVTMHPIGHMIDVLALYGNHVNFTGTSILAAEDGTTTTNKTLLLRPGTWSVSATMSVSCGLYIPYGAVIDVAAGCTFQVNGPLLYDGDGMYQMFSGDGTVTFGTDVQFCRPDWWNNNASPGSTDMTDALNAASSSGASEIKHLGIYAISDTYTLRTSTTYSGPRGGSYVSGGSHPASGYGACLKWIGAASGVMVEAKGIYNTHWDGIDLDGVDYTDDVTGIYHHSDNSPTSQQCTFKNFWAFNLGYGMKIGNNSGGVHYQTDGWEVDNFRFYAVNIGIMINSQNGSQYSNITRGMIGCYHRGIDLEQATGNCTIAHMSFVGLANATATSAYIYFYSYLNEFKIEDIAGEALPGVTGWRDIFVNGSINYSAITVQSSVIVGGIVVAAAPVVCKILSIGNTYNTGAYEDTGVSIGGGNTFISIGDTFVTTDDHVHETGTDNYVAYINPTYWAGIVNATQLKYSFNGTTILELDNTGAVKLGAGANLPTGTVTLTANSATTTVNNTIVTANSLIFLFPATANAAADLGSATSVYISAKTAATSFVITHPNNANADKTFNYLIIN